MKPKDIREAGIPAGKPLRWVQAGLGHIGFLGYGQNLPDAELCTTVHRAASASLQIKQGAAL
jgi:hypothetical protein